MIKFLVVFQTKYNGEEYIIIHADNFFSAIEIAKIAWMQDDNRVCILAIRQAKYQSTLGLSTAVPIQRGWYQLDAVPFECGMSTLGKEYAILLKTKTETRIKTMKQKREKAVVL